MLYYADTRIESAYDDLKRYCEQTGRKPISMVEYCTVLRFIGCSIQNNEINGLCKLPCDFDKLTHKQWQRMCIIICAIQNYEDKYIYISYSDRIKWYLHKSEFPLTYAYIEYLTDGDNVAITAMIRYFKNTSKSTYNDLESDINFLIQSYCDNDKTDKTTKSRNSDYIIFTGFALDLLRELESEIKQT